MQDRRNHVQGVLLLLLLLLPSYKADLLEAYDHHAGEATEGSDPLCSLGSWLAMCCLWRPPTPTTTWVQHH
jgi:hypothetical protein